MSKINLDKLKEIAERFMNHKPATPVVTPEKFAAVKIKGSETSLEYNPNLEVGTPVETSSGTGSVAAADGSYTLENGVVFTVKDGKIDSVQEDGTADTDDTDPKTSEKMSALEAKFSAMETAFEALKGEINVAKEQFAAIATPAQIQEFNDHLKTVGEGILELYKIPVETPPESIVKPGEAIVKTINFEAVAAKFTGEETE